jgi:hypothetical protein
MVNENRVFGHIELPGAKSGGERNRGFRSKV